KVLPPPKRTSPDPFAQSVPNGQENPCYFESLFPDAHWLNAPGLHPARPCHGGGTGARFHRLAIRYAKKEQPGCWKRAPPSHPRAVQWEEARAFSRWASTTASIE